MRPFCALGAVHGLILPAPFAVVTGYSVGVRFMWGFVIQPDFHFELYPYSSLKNLQNSFDHKRQLSQSYLEQRQPAHIVRISTDP